MESENTGGVLWGKYDTIKLTYSLLRHQTLLYEFKTAFQG